MKLNRRNSNFTILAELQNEPVTDALKTKQNRKALLNPEENKKLSSQKTL